MISLAAFENAPEAPKPLPLAVIAKTDFRAWLMKRHGKPRARLQASLSGPHLALSIFNADRDAMLQRLFCLHCMEAEDAHWRIIVARFIRQIRKELPK